MFGDGNEKAQVVFVGEAPGENEDLQGKPFVGRAGKLLDKVAEDCGFKRSENVYIANMLKCRPPKNRDPLPSEIDMCCEYLNKQIEIISPKVVVLVGRISACYFLGADFKISKSHGVAFYKDGRIYFPVYHPAAILRNMNLLPEMENDFKTLKKLVSELK